jgi:ferredoxin-type protein NapG
VGPSATGVPGRGYIRGMSDATDRRAFFTRGFARAVERAADLVGRRLVPGEHIRPPGALPEAGLVAACTRCGECVTACPVHAISLLPPDAGLAAGTPVLRPATTACIMCADMPCAAACPTDALEVPATGWRGVRLSAPRVETERCIAYRDVTCGVCARVCPVGEEALRLDARGRPVFGSACTGCGACVTACVTAPSSIVVELVREVV